MFTFHFQLNDKDYLEFNKYHLFYSPATKKSMMIRRWASPCLVTAFLLWVIFTAENAEQPEAMIGAIIISGMFTLFWLLIFKPMHVFSLKMMVKRFKKTGKLPYGQENELIFEDGFILDRSPNREMKTAYGEIERIVVTNQIFYIYTNSTQAILLPFYAFQGPQGQSEFLAFLQQKAPAAAIVWHNK
ncbi:MAG: YcxB family protein [Oscillospiraceae bacterium]|jgi:hypothetical protein|nr:YcxB family protein [Oscillospiraceae bacterium]